MTGQPESRIERDRQIIKEGKARGTVGKALAYTRLSGPGWLQSAITLGGGSLSGSLYLGVLAGFSLMWLQPLAMILGVVMLSAISYVTLSTGERPFQAINKHINPVLGWGWAIATLMANLVWCMPQFALGTAALRQNLLPTAIGAGSGMEEKYAKLICVLALFFVGGVVVSFYGRGGKGVRIFELILKLMVAVIVVCFFGVVIKMTTESALDWSAIVQGFIPNFDLLSNPSPSFEPFLASTGDYRQFWSDMIVNDQRKVMITAAATAVGINMTFLLPYTIMSRGWDNDFKGLAIFDLATGLLIPFVLATGCVVIAAASQFHAQPAPGLLTRVDANGNTVEPGEKIASGFNSLLDKRLLEEIKRKDPKRGVQAFEDLKKQQPKDLQYERDSLPAADREMAAMLVKRDAFDLAASLEKLTGKDQAQLIFGVGVLGMAISTIIILMLINGFVVCEMLGLEQKGGQHLLACLLAGVAGAIGSFYWDGPASLWLAVPTSMFGMVLLPIAYFTFFFMMNSKPLLGERMPKGGRRWLWNTLMVIAGCLAAFGSYWSVESSPYSTFGFSLMGIFALLVILGHFMKPKTPAAADVAAKSSPH